MSLCLYSLTGRFCYLQRIKTSTVLVDIKRPVILVQSLTHSLDQKHICKAKLIIH